MLISYITKKKKLYSF